MFLNVASLFHVVVENDKIAMDIIKHLKEEGGRVTFIPLNTVKAPSVPSYPQNSDVQPLFKKIKFEELKFIPAFKQVRWKMRILLAEILLSL